MRNMVLTVEYYSTKLDCRRALPDVEIARWSKTITTIDELSIRAPHKAKGVNGLDKLIIEEIKYNQSSRPARDRA